MTAKVRNDTRTRLLDAAADMIAAAPGEDVSLRAICDRVGVKMPTLYHFFGNKQGLIESVIERGFDLYLSRKEAHEPTGDPIQDIREGWDAHVIFGLENPGFYTLMYGKIRPGYSPAPQARPSAILIHLATQAAAQNRLIVPAEQAAAHILATSIGVTLRQIVLATADLALSSAIREATIAAITGVNTTSTQKPRRQEINEIVAHVTAHPDVLGRAETQLLTTWLNRLNNT
ncbi:TetR/AcrR family transcriptional regulator [Pseudoclavibacter helvolus]|uniref:TetR/AcrR family transcriptional regulator n=1 Tax=Pseudoclavibacter helvolus TaxID=255205 RepID=UPI003C777FC3